MSCGKPVVAFRAASLGEMIEDGGTGFLVEPNDRAAFADRVVRLLREPGVRARFGAAAAERVDRHFRWDLTVRRVQKVYQETVDGFRPAR
jgi:glycosyltransferase involved in cell wall biosynthesis